MRIFVSSSGRDYAFVEHLSSLLESEGHEVFSLWSIRLDVSSIQKNILKSITGSDVFIAVVSENSLQSQNCQSEWISALVHAQNHKDKFILIPIALGSVQMPHYLWEQHFFKIDSKSQLSQFVKWIGKTQSEPTISVKRDSKTLIKKKDSKDYKEPVEKLRVALEERTLIKKKDSKDYKEPVEKLRVALKENKLTLVCGAGVSKGSGLPDWNELILSLLDKTLYDKSKKEDPEGLKDMMSMSGPIMGRCLKTQLGDGFEKSIKEKLYEFAAESEEGKLVKTPLIESIIKLSRPQRSGVCLESIITLNFDSMLEDFLTEEKISFKSIYGEGMTCDSKEMPVYHIHGFLPRKDPIEKSNLVFSEDAYHTQFSDHYSWSNITLLYKLMNNTCLLIGVSLKDPNLRRLLDVSRRGNTESSLKHYIVKRIPRSKSSDLNDFQTMLEEQDANSLGLYVLWVEEYEDIPKILDKLS